MAPAEAPSILVIDDDPDFRAIMKIVLGKAGYRPSEAPDGESGLEAAKKDPPGLILLDISMPGLDGLEVCRRLKADPKTRAVPVVLFSVRSQMATVAEGLEAGATDYILKPFDPDDLLTRIGKVLGHGTHRRP